MNIKTLIALREKCESLDQTLEMAQEEALEIQKATGTENLDVMHISNAREIVSMRIGYLTRELEKAQEAEAAKKKGKPEDDKAAEGSDQQPKQPAQQQQQQTPPPAP